jgi:hypothetical protein
LPPQSFSVKSFSQAKTSPKDCNAGKEIFQPDGATGAGFNTPPKNFTLS